MRFILIFSLSISATYGWVEWTDLRVGSSRLPLTLNAAKLDGWKQSGRNKALKIVWHMKNNEPRLMVAFDAQNNVAGLRINQLQSEVVDTYVGVYRRSGLFEELTHGGQKYFSVTVLFTPTSVLKSGGRKKLSTDEPVLGLFVKKGAKYEQINRDGCDHDDTGAVEQGCQENYGLVFSDLGRDSSCNSLSPFYTMWDTQDTGNLIGFGLLSFGSKTLPNGKVVDENTVQMLFPQSPACLLDAAQDGLSALDVWFAYDVSRQSSCPSGNWGDAHCDRRRVSNSQML